MDFRQAPSVAIDGEAIRLIREDKRLTQLYVSKVVGVTTDTVSRWENNRYPTIRRDNAIKLAEALEVEFETILKQDDIAPEVVDELPAEEPKKNRWVLILAVLSFVVIALIYFIQSNSSKPPHIQAVRQVSPYAAPGSRVLVRVKLTSDSQLKGMILREEFPHGWKLVESDPPASSLDNLEGMARWIFRNPELTTAVSYLLEVAPNAERGGTVDFTGELIANPEGRRFVTTFETLGQMQVQPLHWADTNGNQIIDDLEILEVSDLLDETGRLHLGWEQLEKLWDAGGYLWSESAGMFVPFHPQPDNPTSQTDPADQ